MTGPRPVFVGGCERSGTTLLAARLAAHPQVVAVPESQFVVELLRDPPPGPFGAAVPERVLAHWRFLLWELDLDAHEVAGLARCASVGELASALADHYAVRAGGRPRGSVTAWVDHTPWNLRHAVLLAEAMPEARFVHIVRDGRAVAASVMPLAWGPNDALAAAHWWTENVALALVAEQRLGPGRVLRIRYEDLVDDPERVTAEVLAFAGLPRPDLATASSAGTGPSAVIDRSVDESTVDPAPDPTGRAVPGPGPYVAPRYTRHQHLLVDLEPLPERIDAWRRELTRRDVERFESVAETLLAHLGYPCDFHERARGPAVLEQTGRAVAELARFYLLNPPRNRARRLVVRYRARGRYPDADGRGGDR